MAPMTIEGVTATFEEFREGVEADGTAPASGSATGASAIWKSRNSSWTANTNFTLDNYKQVLGGKTITPQRCRTAPP